MSAQLEAKIEKLVDKIDETNGHLVKVVTSNEHRDFRLDDHDVRIKNLEKYKEENIPLMTNLKKSDAISDKIKLNIVWLLICIVSAIIVASFTSGTIKIPGQPNAAQQQEKEK